MVLAAVTIQLSRVCLPMVRRTRLPAVAKRGEEADGMPDSAVGLGAGEVTLVVDVIAAGHFLMTDSFGGGGVNRPAANRWLPTGPAPTPVAGKCPAGLEPAISALATRHSAD